MAVAQNCIAARGGCGYSMSLAPGVAAASILDLGCPDLKLYQLTNQMKQAVSLTFLN